MTVSDLVEAMEQIAPLREAEPWDNVGLLLGDRTAPLGRILLCIDLTPEVVAEARRLGCNAVVAYHPPLFKEVRRLQAGDPVFEAIAAGIAVYTPHTALDVAEGGTNDVLADALYLTRRDPLRPSKAGETFKLVTFIPEDHLETVADALFAAGAGEIGEYRQCSFRSPGTGTFFGGAGTNPTIGQAGRREQVQEVRLETVVEGSRLSEIIAALRSAHPYEEPAFDLVRCATPPRTVGLGRIGSFDEAVPREVLFGRIKRELDCPRLLVAGPTEGEVRKVAVCAGSCGDLLDTAARRGAELYLTGEMKHHDALRAARYGLTVVCVLHSNSERATLGRLRERLSDLLGGQDVLVSEADRDPFTIL